MLKYTDTRIVFREIPDEITLAINISGCPNHCEGCHSPELWEDTGEELTYEVIDNLLKKYPAVTCVALMGGDNDTFEISVLASYLLANSVKVAWYSGKDRIPDNITITDFDYIKLGPYISELGPLDNPNTNQRLYQVKGLNLEDITYKFWK